MLMLIASELVTNAIMHGQQPIELCADWDGRCVRTSSTKVTATSRPSGRLPERAVGGRGLLLVEALSDRCGVAPIMTANPFRSSSSRRAAYLQSNRSLTPATRNTDRTGLDAARTVKAPSRCCCARISTAKPDESMNVTPERSTTIAASY